MISELWRLLRRMLRALFKIEERLRYGIVRVVRGSRFGFGGHAQDATLEDLTLLHESPYYIVLNKHQDVLINSTSRELGECI
jgi:hypothetical protein